MSKAPGRADRKGISLTKLFEMFPDDDTAEAWFAEQRWNNTPACPHCGSTNVLIGARNRTMPYRCREKECRKRFSVKIGTVMQASNLGYQAWAIAIYLLTTSLKSVSSLKLHRDLDITQKSAWHLAHRIRASFVHKRQLLMAGPVEVDETYIGGLGKNMHAPQAESPDRTRRQRQDSRDRHERPQLKPGAGESVAQNGRPDRDAVHRSQRLPWGDRIYG